MQKRKSLFSIVLVVLVLVLAVAMLVACNNQKAKYTITFDDGSEVAKTVTVEEGTALTAEQIPVAKSIEGKNFDGWYIGDTLVEAGYKPTENVTAVAKYSNVQVTVRFVNGGDTNSVVVDYNTAIAADKLPADAQPTDSRIFGFEGWFDGDTKFASDMTFTADKTFTAKFNRTGYIVTVSYGEANLPSVEKVVAKNADGATLLPDGILPANVPDVENKVFLGFYNGSVKASADMEISDDITLKACYVGADDYSGVWVDENKKVVVVFDEQNDRVYIGKNKCYLSDMTFDEGTAQMELIDSSTTWTLSIAGDRMSVLKTSSYGEPEIFIMTNVTNEVDFAGEYVRNNQYFTLTVFDGGFVIADYYGIQYQYAKIDVNDGNYQFVVYDEDGIATIVDASIDKDGNISIDGNLSVTGIWVKDSYIEFRISDGNNQTEIIKHEVNDSYVYVFVDKNGVYSIVTVDKEIEDGGTPGSEIVTLKFADNSELLIKVTYTYYSTSYVLPGAESGTYTMTVDSETQTMVLDGFGNATISGGGKDSFEGTTTYEVVSENLIYLDEFELRIQLSGDTFSIAEKDEFAGVYHLLNSDSYYDTRIELDGYGKVIANSGSYYDEPVYGVYTINQQDGTIAISGIQGGNFNDGDYAVLFDGETLCLNGTYFGKTAESKVGLMEGKWFVQETNDSIVIVNESYYGLQIEVNSTSATNVVVLKYDNTAIQFNVDGNVYSAVLGDVVDGNYTLVLSTDGAEDVIYIASPAASSELFGTWTNADDTIKVVISDKYNVQVDFSEDSDALNDAFLIASNADDKSITVKFQDVNYVIQFIDVTTIKVESENATFSVELNKALIPDADFYGTWTWDDTDMSPYDTGTLVIEANSVTFNGNAVQDIKFEDGELEFTYNGTTFTVYASFGSYRIQDDSYSWARLSKEM